MKKCTVAECGKEGRVDGLCWKHDNRKRKYGDPLAGPAFYGNLPDKERFMKYVEKISSTDCWHWTGAIDKGYGKFRVSGKSMVAHRAAMLLFGTTPHNFKEMLVCHRCDNTRCVNVEHLFVGTHQDNVDDKMRKGRHNGGRGMAYKTAKLTDERVLEIRESQCSAIELATKFGVSTSNINAVRSGKRWKHIGGPVRVIVGHTAGDNHPMSKLNEEKVREIRASNLSTRQISEKFGISIMSAHDAKTGRTWKHIK